MSIHVRSMRLASPQIAGCDVTYVLTGSRSTKVHEAVSAHPRQGGLMQFHQQLEVRRKRYNMFERIERALESEESKEARLDRQAMVAFSVANHCWAVELIKKGAMITHEDSSRIAKGELKLPKKVISKSAKLLEITVEEFKLRFKRGLKCSAREARKIQKKLLRKAAKAASVSPEAQAQKTTQKAAKAERKAAKKALAYLNNN